MKTKNQKIILTVGNRWVGFRIVRALILGHGKLGALREGNHIIRCLIRPEEDKKKLEKLGAGICVGDIRDPYSCRELMGDAAETA